MTASSHCLSVSRGTVGTLVEAFYARDFDPVGRVAQVTNPDSTAFQTIYDDARSARFIDEVGRTRGFNGTGSGDLLRAGLESAMRRLAEPVEARDAPPMSTTCLGVP